jgi:hypothetical protein
MKGGSGHTAPHVNDFAFVKFRSSLFTHWMSAAEIGREETHEKCEKRMNIF